MKTRRFLQLLAEKWWVVYGLSVVWYALYHAIAVYGPPIPLPRDEVVFYPWIVMGRELLILPSFAGLLFAIALYAFKKQAIKRVLILSAMTLIAGFAALWRLGPIVGRQIYSFEPPPPLNHIDSEYSSGNVYHLVRHRIADNVLGHDYILYECDSGGIICRVIYRYRPQSLEDVYADNADNPPSLSIDNERISVHIADRVVHTYLVSERLT